MPDRDIPTATPPSINRQRRVRFPDRLRRRPLRLFFGHSRCKQIPGASRPARANFRALRQLTTGAPRNQPRQFLLARQPRHAP